MIPADRPIAATLTAQQWNVVLGALQEAPWRVANPVIQALFPQINPQEDDAPRPPASGNGVDEHVSN